MLTRRKAIAAAGASACSWLGAFAGPAEISVGANTAITGYDFFEAVALLRRLGFPVIEIHAMGKLGPVPGAFPGYRFDELGEAEKARVRKALEGVPRITAHLPYTDLEYFSADAKVAVAARRVIDIAIEGSAYFGAVIGVFHPKPGPGFTPEQEWPVMIEHCRRWGDLARQRGMKLALETGFPKSAKQFVQLIREIDHPAVGATLDVGHQSQYAELAGIAAADRGTPAAIRAYNDLNLRIVDGLGPKLLHLHVHDIDPNTWKEHRPMSTGFIDYPRLIGKLRENRFSGSLVLELAATAEEMPALLRQAKKVFEDYLG